jgi:hypothetical protein
MAIFVRVLLILVAIALVLYFFGFTGFLLAFGAVFLALCIFVAMRNKSHPGNIEVHTGMGMSRSTRDNPTFVDEEEEIRKETE